MPWGLTVGRAGSWEACNFERMSWAVQPMPIVGGYHPSAYVQFVVRGCSWPRPEQRFAKRPTKAGTYLQS